MANMKKCSYWVTGNVCACVQCSSGPPEVALSSGPSTRSYSPAAGLVHLHEVVGAEGLSLIQAWLPHLMELDSRRQCIREAFQHCSQKAKEIAKKVREKVNEATMACQLAMGGPKKKVTEGERTPDGERGNGGKLQDI
ncbi:uncharacterized protein LOC127011515 [Drosophila biarmipes]|uniref:uncharacterized protein LOC127011515 n=1 Tax=Drosophila biarmipes TaxID=125945 RepID=UPI0021CC9569|nr:uncharacterized protein LOC127011515 [Drosophila biarmipes]